MNDVATCWFWTDQIRRARSLFQTPVLLPLIFFMLPLNSEAQKMATYIKPKSELYLYDLRDNKKVCTDTLTLLNMFDEYSFHVDTDKLFVCWAYHLHPGGKCYQINYYPINSDGKAEFKSYNIIDLDKFETMLKVVLTKNGISLYFKNGDVLTLSYSCSYPKNDKIIKPLKKIDRLLRKYSS